jgi:sugar phosphate isomerase/epimerase
MRSNPATHSSAYLERVCSFAELSKMWKELELTKMNHSRRQFNRFAFTGIASAATASFLSSDAFAAVRPDSKFGGVQIGLNTGFSYHNMPNDAETVLKYLVRDNINAIEMQTPTHEDWAGAPKAPPRPYPEHIGGQQVGSPPRPPLTPEQQVTRKKYAEAMTHWRTSMSISKYGELRKMYNDAGVSFYAFKLPLEMRMPDAEFDYAFTAAKTLGCNQLTMEMPDGNAALTARVGRFAEEHKLPVGYHAHLQATPTTWDEALSQSTYNCINLDIGHYVAAGNRDTLEFIRKNHARITSLHIKDRKFPENGGQNVPWGTGDTPIKEVLQLVKKEGYQFPCTIELEYAPPEGSDSEKEIIKCLAYAKAALA